MGLHKYGFEAKKPAGRAQAHDVDASFKDMSQIFRAIRHKTIPAARKILEECVSMKKAIPYSKFAKGSGHKSELGGQRGRYPKKEARIALKLLNNAVANAVHKGMDEAKLVVSHAFSNKQTVYKRYRRVFAGGHTLGYGRQSMWSDYETCMAQIAVEESDKIKAVKDKKTPGKGAEKSKRKNEADEAKKHKQSTAINNALPATPETAAHKTAPAHRPTTASHETAASNQSAHKPQAINHEASEKKE